MFLTRHMRGSRRLTDWAAPPHNSLTKALVPQVYVPGTDLAGIPLWNQVPALHPALLHFRVTDSSLLRRGHKPHLWRPGMAKAIKQGNAATTLGGDASAPRPGAAQPPLDLSLGHIGTRDREEDAELVDTFGPFRVVFDSANGQARIFTDDAAFSNRQERRAAERKVFQDCRAGF